MLTHDRLARAAAPPLHLLCYLLCCIPSSAPPLLHLRLNACGVLQYIYIDITLLMDGDPVVSFSYGSVARSPPRTNQNTQSWGGQILPKESISIEANIGSLQ